MAELRFDIHLEFDPFELAKQRDQTRAIAEVSHRAALQHADHHGLDLRHPEPIEVHVGNGQDLLSGRHCVLVATRWVADTRRTGALTPGG